MALNGEHALLATLILALGPACRTTAETSPVGLADNAPTAAEAECAWRVVRRGRTVGSVVRYRELSEPHRHYLAVRNVHHQDVGVIDALGRAWRYRPHDEPEHLGSDSRAKAVALILDLDAPPVLIEIPAAELGD